MSHAEFQAIAAAAAQMGEVVPAFDFTIAPRRTSLDDFIRATTQPAKVATPVSSTVFARFSFNAKAGL